MANRLTIMMAAALALVPLAGCGSRASRVEAALVKAGVSQAMSACLAPRLADRLSDDQLRALAAAARGPGGGQGKAGAGAIVARIAQTGDPEIADIVGKAVLHCALKG